MFNSLNRNALQIATYSALFLTALNGNVWKKDFILEEIQIKKNICYFYVLFF